MLGEYFLIIVSHHVVRSSNNDVIFSLLMVTAGVYVEATPLGKQALQLKLKIHSPLLCFSGMLGINPLIHSSSGTGFLLKLSFNIVRE